MLRKILERALLVCGGIALALIATEGLVNVGYWAVRGHGFPREDYHSAMLEQMAAGGKDRVPSGGGEYELRGIHEVIHPYLGFVPDPAYTADGVTIGDPGQIPARSESELIVGLFGGSFAGGLCSFADAELRRVLARPGKSVRMLCLAAGGYKQPQQLLALAYLLAQGAHFDLVINVDGFNEIALPLLENKPQGVAPIYPRGWFWRVGKLKDPSALQLLAELSRAGRERAEWAEPFARWGLYRSSLLALAWERGDRLFGARWVRIVTEISEHKIEQKKSYAATGPTMTFTDDPSYYGYLARVWKDSSLQMKRLCDANGIAYAHFLQPNQHVEGAKSMGPEEKKVALGGPYPRAVALGYPQLRQEGEALRGAGVAFHDLTMVFKDVPDPVYSDSCCHLNGAGYAMVARAIGDAIGSQAEGSPQEPGKATISQRSDP